MPCPRQHQQAASKSSFLPQAVSRSFEHSFIMSSLWLRDMELPCLVACWPAQLQTNCLDVSCSRVDRLAIMPALTSSISQVVSIFLQGCNCWLANNQQRSVDSLSTVQPVNTASKVCAIQIKLFMSLQWNFLLGGLTIHTSVRFYHASIPACNLTSFSLRLYQPCQSSDAGICSSNGGGATRMYDA